MHAAQVTEWGKAPECVSVSEPTESGIKVKVEAVGVHNVVRSRASGKHYTAKTLPHTPGIDGIGTVDGKRVYFTTFATGTMAEYVVVPSVVPCDLDPVQGAALVNPALSSWMSMTSRAQLPPDFTVLILGATSASGKLAMHLAKSLGAKKVLGWSRGKDLDELLQEPVDLVLDYVYGSVALEVLQKVKGSVQYVQIGELSREPFAIPGALLRSKDITIRGSGPGAWAMEDVVKELPRLFEALKGAEVPVRVVKLKDIEKEWSVESKERVVVTM